MERLEMKWTHTRQMRRKRRRSAEWRPMPAGPDRRRRDVVGMEGSPVNSSLKMTIAAAIAVVAGAACTPAAVAPSTVVSPPPVTPSAAAASAAPSAVPPPSPSGSAGLGPLDTSTWKTYTSTRYGFTIGHPADWVERPSQHDYVFPADAAVCCPPPATENIHTPIDDVGMSIWSVALPAGTTADAWIQAYCQVMEADSPCTALQGSTVPASMDGHAGRLVLFKSDTQAFIPVGDRMYVVACWRSENELSVVRFGGARRLVEAYLSTMHLLPGGPVPSAASPRPS